jgi:hypothetical protein
MLDLMGRTSGSKLDWLGWPVAFAIGIGLVVVGWRKRRD